ncbi:MAG: virulence RhuM family protein [Proteobacteria bacterium]|nr:virulence RhuM family protein [Pseudomonadota bacterium]
MTNTPESKQTNFLLYTGDDGKVNVEVFLQDETIWLTQKAIGELFGKSKATISEHLSNIFETGELVENSVSSILETTASDGKSYKTRFYNLDAIISVGYRVNSYQATQFRIWATKTLKEFIIKGFVQIQKSMHHRGTETTERKELRKALFFNLLRLLRVSVVNFNCTARKKWKIK